MIALAAASALAATLHLPQGEVRFTEQGQGTAIVMLHGFGSSLESWGPSIDVLSQQHHVLALDARGFGLSDRSAGDYSLSALGRDVTDAMDARGIDRATVVAHSWGSAVALALALQAPDRVDRLVLVSSLAYEPQVPWTMRATRARGVGELLVNTFYTARLDANIERAFHDPSVLTYEQMQAMRYVTELPGSRAAALAISREVRLGQQDDRYGELDVPTLVIWGRQDRILNPWWARRLGRDLGADVELLDDCGHFPMLEQPEHFAALVEGFVP